MTMSTEATWRILDWDSEFFDFPIGRIFDVQSLAQTLSESEQRNVRCLYFLAEAGDIATIRVLERHGFGLVDIRLTLVHDSPGALPSAEVPRIRLARAEDIPKLELIARSCHQDTRFYSDYRFPRDRCDALYATWIAKSCGQGFADAVFVPETAAGEASGYVTCNKIEPDGGQIGLLAVAPEARGAGAGKRLIQRALAWAAAQGATNVITVTQGRNVSAIRTYERCGFVAQRTQLWYHRWSDIR
jgi:dTDP-4-amino-4,6-dideoxy-D-galactose acyltransferase